MVMLYPPKTPAPPAKEVLQLVEDRFWPAWTRERERLDRIDNWYRWNHDAPHQPRQATAEYKELSGRAQTPWLGLVVTSVAQALYVEGYRRADSSDNVGPWKWWQASGMDARQIPLHRAALAYGLAYATVLPGEDEFGFEMPIIRGHSPRRMMAFYVEPQYDEWPKYALRVDPVWASSGHTTSYDLRLYDRTSVHVLKADAMGSTPRYVEEQRHDLGVCPVVRYANDLDLEGRSGGEVEPFIPMAGRIDQTTFDRLVVQRFSSWVVRTIAGMAKPDGDQDAAAERLRLKVEDLLVAEDVETKFGSLPATPLDGFIAAAEADIRALAAVTQTPAHELLGQLANLSAEALAAARASLSAKVAERQHTFGESHEQTLRLAAWVMGDKDGARDRMAQVRWGDTEIRSLSQAADALGKLAMMLGIPVEMLFERIPGWTQQDVARAVDLREKAGMPAVPTPVPTPPAAPAGA